eukprot:GILI01015208.1.p2 GENE.GILI01015208.1~~GILI01015208.1.p2  ORF type:complete len:168 (-),score=32.60 GILI01015208.1:142-645(-)
MDQPSASSSSSISPTTTESNPPPSASEDAVLEGRRTTNTKSAKDTLGMRQEEWVDELAKECKRDPELIRKCWTNLSRGKMRQDKEQEEADMRQKVEFALEEKIEEKVWETLRVELEESRDIPGESEEYTKLAQKWVDKKEVSMCFVKRSVDIIFKEVVEVLRLDSKG